MFWLYLRPILILNTYRKKVHRLQIIDREISFLVWHLEAQAMSDLPTATLFTMEFQFSGIKERERVKQKWVGLNLYLMIYWVYVRIELLLMMRSWVFIYYLIVKQTDWNNCIFCFNLNIKMRRRCFIVASINKNRFTKL